MKKITLLFSLLWLITAQNAFAALAIDGTPVTATPANAASGTVTFTVPSTNDVIVLFIKNTTGATVSTITDVSNLTWAKRKQVAVGGGVLNAEEWYAVSSTTQTSDVVTVNFSGATTGIRLSVLGVSGANTGTPFDTNVSLPGSNTTSAATSLAATISTTNANDMLISSTYIVTSGTITRPSGFSSAISVGSFADISNQIVSSTQSSLAVTYNYSNSTAAAMIVDAIQAASAGVAGVPVTNTPYFLGGFLR